jgi:WD40 repeat protein
MSGKAYFDTLLFEDEIVKLTNNFTGRAWILEEIRDWFYNRDEKHFLLTGEPGIGKSALSASIIKQGALPIIPHFCLANRAETISPSRFLRSIAAQISKLVPDYNAILANTINPVHLSINIEINIANMQGGQATGVIINHLKVADPVEEYNILIDTPVKKLPHSTSSIMFVVDGLDEAVSEKNDNIPALLAKMADLPSWVRIFCTSREERRVLRYFDKDYYSKNLKSQAAIDDTNEYISNRYAAPVLRLMVQPKENVENLVNYIGTIANGNFLFAKILLDDIEQGRQPTDQLNAFPKSLNDHYHRFFLRFNYRDWTSLFRPVLQTIAVAQAPLTENHICLFTGINKTNVRQTLGVLMQYLSVSTDDRHVKHYAVYHQSLRDFLHDGENNQDFYSAPEDAHLAIAIAIRDQFEKNWEKADSYSVKQYPLHLGKAAKYDLLRDTLTDLLYVNARFVAKLGADLATDYANAFKINDAFHQDKGLKDFQLFITSETNILSASPHQIWQQANNQPDDSAVCCSLQTLIQAGNVSRPLFKWLNKPFQKDQCLMTFTGFSDWIVCCKALPQGNVVGIDVYGNLRIWDAFSFSIIFSHSLNVGHIYQAHFSPNNELLAVVTGNQLYIYDTAKYEICQCIDLDTVDIKAIDWSPDSVWLAVGREGISDDQFFQIVNALTGDITYQYKTDERVSCCSWSPDQEHIAYGSPAGMIYIIDPVTGTLVHRFGESRTVIKGNVHTWTTFSGHSSQVNTCAWSPDGKRFASGAGDLNSGQERNDCSVRIWDWVTKQEVAVMRGHNDSVNTCGWSPDGKLLFSGSGSVVYPAKDNNIRIWDSQNFEQVACLEGHTSEIVSCVWTTAGNRFISCSKDETIRLWEIQQVRPSDINGLNRIRTKRVWYSPDWQKIAVIQSDHRLIIWRLADGVLTGELMGHTDNICDVAWSPCGKKIATASEDLTAMVWDTQTGICLKVLKGHEREDEVTYTAGGHRMVWGAVTHCDWSPDGSRLATGSRDGTIVIWDPVAGTKKAILARHQSMIGRFQWSPDGKRIISTGDGFEHIVDLSFKIWDSETGIQLRTYEEAIMEKDMWPTDPLSVADDSSGSCLDLSKVSALLSLTVKKVEDRGAYNIHHWRLSPDGKSLAFCKWSERSWEKNAKGKFSIWDRQSRQSINALELSVNSFEWFPDNQHLILEGENGVISLFHVYSKAPIATFTTAGNIQEYKIMEGGRNILVIDTIGKLYFLQCPAGVIGNVTTPAIRLYDFTNKKWNDFYTIRCAYCGQPAEQSLQQLTPVLVCANCSGAQTIQPVIDNAALHSILRPLGNANQNDWFDFAYGLYYTNQDPALIYDACDKTLELAPAMLQAWYLKGIVKIKNDETAKGVDCFLKAVETAPEDYNAWFYYADTLASVMKYEEAISAAKKSLHIHNNNPDVWDLLGKIYTETENYAEAKRWFDKSLAVGQLTSIKQAEIVYKHFNDKISLNRLKRIRSRDL